MFYYSLFDLNVASEIELDGFRPIPKQKKIDINVYEGSLPSLVSWNGVPHETSNCTYDQFKCLLKLPEDQGKFLIQKLPGRIDVAFQFGHSNYKQTLLSYFYGTGLSVILHYRQHFILHASAVYDGNDLTLFCGRSGIGKSTIAASLKNKGFKIFSDDKCMLSRDLNNDLIAKPGLQIMRLWQNSLEQIETSQFLSDPKKVLLKKDKFQFLINSSDQITQHKLVRSIFIIQNNNIDNIIRCEELQGILKIKLLRSQIFRLTMISGLGLEKELWNFLTKVLSDVSVYLVHRPKKTSIADFTSYIEQYIYRL